MKQKESLKSNRHYLQEQINFRKEQERFEKDVAVNQAKLMNQKAADEIENETQRTYQQRLKRIQNKDDLRDQGLNKVKENDRFGMNEQERALNRDRLTVIK
mmetsp:Transcript_9720/g.8563  ORF Transcript_9720/g.8563 Transcript_9720/m.8563 type:complete len:101 (-) Transcript_9720:32-334(-)